MAECFATESVLNKIPKIEQRILREENRRKFVLHEEVTSRKIQIHSFSTMKGSVEIFIMSSYKTI